MLIGLNGLINSGKGTVSDYLVKDRGFIKLSFAGALKDVVSILFDVPRELLEGDTEESRKFRETKLEYWSDKLSLKNEITPRYLLQFVGTEIVRNNLAQDFWVNRLQKEIHKHKNLGHNIVIDDVRFLNEAEMIKNNEGKLFRVVRGPEPSWWEDARLNNRQIMEEYNPGVHESEWASADPRFENLIDDIIQNNETQKELHKNIETLFLKGI